jgi:hypothetical protein
MTEIQPSPDQEAALSDLAMQLNTRLENAVATSSSRAFNLGCSVGLLPGFILVGLTLIITHGNWVAAIVISILMLMGLVLFANLIALITRNNVLKRYYSEEILPELKNRLLEMKLARSDFDRMARMTLPPTSGLLHFAEPSLPDQSKEGYTQWNQSIIRWLIQVLRWKS